MKKTKIGNILIVDSNSKTAHSISKKLTENHYSVKIASDSAEYFEFISTFKPDVLLMSLELHNSELGAIDLFKALMSNKAVNSKVLVYSINDKKPWINEIYKIGQYHLYGDIIDFSLNNILSLINETVKIQRSEVDCLSMQVENLFLKKSLIQSHPFIGESSTIRDIRDNIARFAKADEDIFLIGETGTGKEIAAYFYFLNSPRFSKPFQTVNCSALTENLIESELFGHIKGSFTSADKTKTGLFERCDKGILFLDEITNLSLGAQSKILRAIENHEIQVVGGASKQVDTKLIFASNSTLSNLLKPDVFRKDLYYRIEGNIIELPPLVERDDDIVLLMSHFLTSLSPQEIDTDYFNLHELKDILLSYSWPGNIRELKNFCKYLLLNAQTIDYLTIKKHLESKIKLGGDYSCDLLHKYLQLESLKESSAQFEKDYLIYHLNENNWLINQTAMKIGIERTTLYKKMKAYNISSKERK